MVLSEIRLEARNRMQGLWGTCVPIWLIYLLIMMVPGFVIKSYPVQFIISLLLGGPLTYSISKIFLRNYHHEQVDIGQLFEGFNEFTRVFTAYALIMLYTILWSLLLIIPGIMAALGYTMTWFIMAENPEMQATEAMRQSKEMMMGHKAELFWLGFSFIGWMILSIFTMGIGLLWLESYIYTSIVIFYYKIKGGEEAILQTGETLIHAQENVVQQEEPEIEKPATDN